MLAELAAANAAFAVIKTTISNGRELVDAGAALSKYFTAKSSLAKKVEKAKGNKTLLEEFMALEKLKQQETALRELMVYHGRGGMWEDWVKFEAAAARDRKEAEHRANVARTKKNAKYAKYGSWFLLTLLILTVVALFGYLGYMITNRDVQ